MQPSFDLSFHRDVVSAKHVNSSVLYGLGRKLLRRCGWPGCRHRIAACGVIASCAPVIPVPEVRAVVKAMQLPQDEKEKKKERLLWMKKDRLSCDVSP